MADQVTHPDQQSKTSSGEQAESKPDAGKSSQRPPRWPWFAAGLVVLGFIAVVLYLVFVPKADIWTDDAYVMVHYATIAPRVSGQVNSVAVDDNQLVKAGQVLVTLDPRDFQTRVEEAEAALERDQARLADASANVARQPALITQQQAEVASAQARLDFSQANEHRYTNLAASGAGTQQQHQQADTTMQQDRAALQAAQAALDASQRQLDVLKSQESASKGVLASDRATLEQARLNLSYTTIVAPVDGMVGEKTVQVGNYVSPGAAMLMVVPLDQIYIVSNYREEDLRHVRSGQDVKIHVDAYDIVLDGKVDSVPPATGAALAPIAPNNATGNFTKIVQRLPVKVDVSPGQPLARLLRVGLSVETTIHTAMEDVVEEQERSSNRITVH